MDKNDTADHALKFMAPPTIPVLNPGEEIVCYVKLRRSSEWKVGFDQVFRGFALEVVSKAQRVGLCSTGVIGHALHRHLPCTAHCSLC